MRKALVLAVMLLLALSAVVSAEHDYPNQPLEPKGWVDGGYNGEIDVNIWVEPFAYIDKLDTEDMYFTLNTPAAMGNAYNIIRDVVFATNTPVIVRLTETFTGSFPATEALHTALLLQDFSDATTISEVTGQPGARYASAAYSFPAGKHVGKMNVGIGWYNTPEKKQDQGSWDDLPWWEVLSGEYEGIIGVTIEPVR